MGVAMKLHRSGGANKYAVINLEKLKEAAGKSRGHDSMLTNAIGVLNDLGLINYGAPGSKDEHFVLMLKDRFAQPALYAYAEAAAEKDPEYGAAVGELAHRSGPDHPNCKDPD